MSDGQQRWKEMIKELGMESNIKANATDEEYEELSDEEYEERLMAMEYASQATRFDS